MKKGASLFLFLAVFLSFFSIVLAEEGQVSVEFANQAGGCYKTSNVSGWMNSDSQVYNWSVGADGSLGNCLLSPDGGVTFYTNYSCCPSGWSCQQDPTGNPSNPKQDGGRCVSNIEFCFNIGSEGNCNLSDRSVAERTLGVSEKFVQYLVGTATCFAYSSADCVWIRPDGATLGSCQGSFINITGINDTVNGTCTENPMMGSCVYVYNDQVDNCDTAGQNITIDYSAQFSAKYLNGTNVTDQSILNSLGGSCVPKKVAYACSASIQLPGFSLFNFFVSILGIGIVYFLFRKNFKENI
jgi:hypothetical protein